MKSLSHLQTEEPTMTFEDWFVELVGHYAKAMNIEKLAARRYISIDAAMEWYSDGFTPYACFRENFSN